MLLSDFTNILIANSPCHEGMKWYEEVTRSHATTTTFFKSLKKIKKAAVINPDASFNKYQHYSPHGYLVYMFRMMLDWSEVDSDIMYYSKHMNSTQYRKFIKKHFNVENDFDISIPKLCDALTRAFEEE